MAFKHRLKNIDEEAFLFYFRHQNIRALDNLIDLWQNNEKNGDVTITDMKLNLTILLTLLTRLIVKDGYPSETIFAKTEFMVDLMEGIHEKEAFQNFERKIIHEYFQLFIIQHRKTGDLNVNHILNHLYVNLHRKVTLDELSEELGTSKGHLVKVFKDTMDSTIMQYHMMLKMERADYFLTSTGKSLTDIAFELGFHDQSHFARTFKRLRGITPKQFRIKHNV